MQTMKVKPWSEEQGDFVLINADDFDPSKHERLDGEAKAPVADQAGEAVEHAHDAQVASARRGRKPKAE